VSELAGTPGELRMTVTITRKDTGAVETYQMVGRVTPEVIKQLDANKEGVKDVSNA
jgi:hypothetical protein